MEIVKKGMIVLVLLGFLSNAYASHYKSLVDLYSEHNAIADRFKDYKKNLTFSFINKELVPKPKFNYTPDLGCIFDHNNNLVLLERELLKNNVSYELFSNLTLDKKKQFLRDVYADLVVKKKEIVTKMINEVCEFDTSNLVYLERFLLKYNFIVSDNSKENGYKELLFNNFENKSGLVSLLLESTAYNLAKLKNKVKSFKEANWAKGNDGDD